MFGYRGKNLRLLIRMSVYIMVIAGLFFLRGRVDLGGLARSLTGGGAADSTLVLSGADLAPTLAEFLVRRYQIDYPQVQISVKGGGTRAALEDLINGRADVAFLNRPPTREETLLFESAVGDSVAWYPIALGTILVIGGAGRSDSTVSLAELADLASGKGSAQAARLYVADPNSGLWEAFCAKLALAPSGEARTPGVIFLKDDSTVVAAVAVDDESLGLVSSFAQAGDAAVQGVRALGLRSGPEASAVWPDLEATYAGEYPLWSYLYVGCLPHGDKQGDMFVTSVTSPRGQRQIEQTEFLPAQQVPRVVYVNRNATGTSGQ